MDEYRNVEWVVWIRFLTFAFGRHKDVTKVLGTSWYNFFIHDRCQVLGKKYSIVRVLYGSIVFTK